MKRIIVTMLSKYNLFIYHLEYNKFNIKKNVNYMEF